LQDWQAIGIGPRKRGDAGDQERWIPLKKLINKYLNGQKMFTMRIRATAITPKATMVCFHRTCTAGVPPAIGVEP